MASLWSGIECRTYTLNVSFSIETVFIYLSFSMKTVCRSLYILQRVFDFMSGESAVFPCSISAVPDDKLHPFVVKKRGGDN